MSTSYPSSIPLSRRRFVGAAGLVAGSMITRPLYGANAPSNKLNVALIGVWGRGLAHYNSIAEENVVALCDINEARFPDALKRFPGATTYVEWRKCLDHKG
ncbi:MAG: gfo/Idh/MocA family oxidoreductase, partial [Prosthecobacter sp.]